MTVGSPDWQAVATVLYAELGRWGFGDFHYGNTPRDPKVLAALAVYDEALAAARDWAAECEEFGCSYEDPQVGDGTFLRQAVEHLEQHRPDW